MEAPVVVVLLVAAALVAIVVPFMFRAPGRALHKRFVALGSLKGRTRREIEKAAGPAAQETALPDGRTLLQWRATGYHIALVFGKDGRCVGVTHENGRRVRGSGGTERQA
jgi:hypothetical protein